MKCLKETPFHKSALHVLSYDFGELYLYDRFVIGEFREGVVVTWEKMGKVVTEEIAGIYGQKACDLVYISNRINQYSVIPTDWLKFFNRKYTLRGYAIVSYTKRGYFNAMLEKAFVKTRLKWFDSLESAIQWAR